MDTDYMELGLKPELLAQARKMQTPEELAELANSHGVEMTAEQARVCYEKLNPPFGELEDDELEAVSGGGCTGIAALEAPKYKVGQHVMDRHNLFCNTQHSTYRGAQYTMETCRSPYWAIKRTGVAGAGTARVYDVECPLCGMSVTLHESDIKVIN